MPMPAAFMETTLGSPIFRVFLQFLPAGALLALAGCRRALCEEVREAAEAWSLILQAHFGGDVALARRRCWPGSEGSSSEDGAAATSPGSSYAMFGRLTTLRRRLAAVEVVMGDLAEVGDMGVDCVVCPTSVTLEAYGPAALAIWQAAGQEQLGNHIARLASPVQQGEVVWTPGFDLGTKGIIHAVGPDRRAREGDVKLRRCYNAALATVLERGYESVAFGSISTGGNGFSTELGALIAAEEMRNVLAGLQPSAQLRILVVAFEREVFAAFRDALARVRRQVNKDLLDRIPMIVLDSMLPGQRLTMRAEDFPLAFHEPGERIGVMGFKRSSMSMNGFQSLSAGVEVRVQQRADRPGHLEIVATKRRFSMPGALNLEEGPPDARGRHRFTASVLWTAEPEEDEEEVTTQEVRGSVALEPLVEEWLGLVRNGRERQAGQMGQVLADLGPMPAAEEVTQRALWVCALINPLPALGVAYEIRPAALMAKSAKERLKVARKGLQDSIANLLGTQPLG